jgi:hypothetical protein
VSIAPRTLMHLTLVFAMTGIAHAATPAPRFQEPPAASTPARPAVSVVWVNTASGYYHNPTSRHYGKTKHGKYMTEPDAIRAGYRPARN